MNIKCPQCGHAHDAPAEFCQSCGIRFVTITKKKDSMSIVSGLLVILFLIPFIGVVAIYFSTASQEIEVTNHSLVNQQSSSVIKANIKNLSKNDFTNFRAVIEVLDFSPVKFASDMPQVSSITKCDVSKSLNKNQISPVYCEIYGGNNNYRYHLKFYNGDSRISVANDETKSFAE